MARKGIAPWENGAGQIGTPDLKWKQVLEQALLARGISSDQGTHPFKGLQIILMLNWNS